MVRDKKKMSRYTKSAYEGHFCLYRVVKRHETLHITFYIIKPLQLKYSAENVKYPFKKQNVEGKRA